MTDTITISLSVEDANALISAASKVLVQLDYAIENGEHISTSWRELDMQRRAKLSEAARSLRHRVSLEEHYAWKYGTQK